MKRLPISDILSPKAPAPESFRDPKAAVVRLQELFDLSVGFLTEHFSKASTEGRPSARVRAFYPEIRFSTSSFELTDSRLSFGHVSEPGHYSTTITRPDLFAYYLEQQMKLIIKNHDQPVTIQMSDTPMPVHFAVAGDPDVTVPQEGAMAFTLRDVFDVPDLETTNDDIVNGEGFCYPDGSEPLAPFTAQRVDYSLARLAHYTATTPDIFRTTCFLPTTSFMSKSLRPMRARCWLIRRAATRPL